MGRKFEVSGLSLAPHDRDACRWRPYGSIGNTAHVGLPVVIMHLMSEPMFTEGRRHFTKVMVLTATVTHCSLPLPHIQVLTLS
jgi:hypothetical protein